MMRYIVVKNEEDIKKAVGIITNRKYIDYEIGIRFKVSSFNIKFNDKIQFATINKFKEKNIMYPQPDKAMTCNVIIHRVYSDCDTAVSGDSIDHFDIIGSDRIVENHGIISNIKGSRSLEFKLCTIYERILFKIMNNRNFYKKWVETHDIKTGFLIEKKKVYKIKYMFLTKSAPYTIIRKRD